MAEERMVETSAGPIPRADAKPQRVAPTLEDIPTYRRPLGAERVLGEMDELGNPVYRMPNGRKITVMEMTGEEGQELAEQDKWPLGKAAKDARELLWNFYQNPSAPSWKQIKAMPAAIVQQIQQDMENPTIGSTLSIALGMGAGSAGTSAPEGALRVFGGRKAKVNPITVAEEKSREIGISLDELTPDEQWEQLGIFQGLDGEMRFEIPDVDVDTTPVAHDIWEREVMPTMDLSSRWEFNLSDVIDHPMLYEAYPEIADMPLAIVTGDRKGWNGAFFGLEDGIEIYAESFRLGGIDDTISTILHEVQHGIQKIEGFDSGSNPSMFLRQNLPAAEKQLQKVVKTIEFLEPFRENGITIVGRSFHSVPLKDPDVIRKARQLGADEASKKLGVLERDGEWFHVETVIHVMDENGAFEGIPVSELSQNSIEGYDMLDIRMSKNKKWMVDKDTPPFGADTFEYEFMGESFYANKRHILDPKKTQSHLINRGLTADFIIRSMRDSRGATQKYLSTTGEIEAETVVRRYERGRMVTQYIPPEFRNKPYLDATHPYVDLEEFEKKNGEAIRRPQIPEDD